MEKTLSAANKSIVEHTFDQLRASFQESFHALKKKLAPLPEELVLEITKDYVRISVEKFSGEELRYLIVVLEGLESSEKKTRNDLALDAAKARAEKIKGEWVEKGDLLDAKGMAKALGLSRQAVNKTLQGGGFFALRAGSNDLYYPAFLAEQKLLGVDLKEIMDALAQDDAWSKWIFFSNPNAALGGESPIEALREGKKSAVLKAATAYAER